MNYDVDYFIKKFEADAESTWHIGAYESYDGDTHCALGKCGLRIDKEHTAEAQALVNIFSVFMKIETQFPELVIGNPYILVSGFNDGRGPYKKYGSTPKQRILSALYDIKKMQQSEPEFKEVTFTKIKEETRQLISAN